MVVEVVAVAEPRSSARMEGLAAASLAVVVVGLEQRIIILSAAPMPEQVLMGVMVLMVHPAVVMVLERLD